MSLFRELTALPPSASGMRIGLFGGSFNPAHEGHLLVAQQCLRRLRLDAVWALVSPGNPLKSLYELRPLAERVERAREVLCDPRIQVTGWEAGQGLHYTADTLTTLRALLPRRKLVWIMGADNLLTFHRWKGWKRIATTVPMAIYARPGAERAVASRTAQRLARFRLDETDAILLPSAEPPAWVLLHGVESSLSSTALRTRHKPVVKAN